MVIIPELTISAANIEDVEIIQRPSDNNNKSAVNKTSKTKIKAKNATTNLYNNNSDNISNINITHSSIPSKIKATSVNAENSKNTRSLHPTAKIDSLRR